MTKEDLSQLKNIKKEIELIKQRIEDERYHENEGLVTDGVKGSSPIFPFVEHSILITGRDSEAYFKKIYKLKDKLNNRIKDLLEKVEIVEEFIETIDDSEMRSILALRYINGLDWREIAANIGCKGDGSTERKKHDRFLKLSPNSPEKVL